MSTERKILITAASICIIVIAEGLLSAARHVAGNDPASGIVAIARVLIAWWIGSALVATLKDNPKA